MGWPENGLGIDHNVKQWWESWSTVGMHFIPRQFSFLVSDHLQCAKSQVIKARDGGTRLYVMIKCYAFDSRYLLWRHGGGVHWTQLLISTSSTELPFGDWTGLQTPVLMDSSDLMASWQTIATICQTSVGIVMATVWTGLLLFPTMWEGSCRAVIYYHWLLDY